jgi:hypothetical protein
MWCFPSIITTGRIDRPLGDIDSVTVIDLRFSGLAEQYYIEY